MPRFVGSLLLLCIGLLSAGCQKFKGEPTLTPPSGWKEASFPGAKKVWAGPAENGFAPNINIVEESYSGSLETYVEANIATLQKAFPHLEQLGKPATAPSAVMMLLYTPSSGSSPPRSPWWCPGVTRRGRSRTPGRRPGPGRSASWHGGRTAGRRALDRPRRP